MTAAINGRRSVIFIVPLFLVFNHSITEDDKPTEEKQLPSVFKGGKVRFGKHRCWWHVLLPGSVF